jgi:hypothetical protein
MTDTPESTIEPTTVGEQPRYDKRYGAPSRLGQAAAWVVIVAGVVFVVGSIFFWGLFLGWSSGAQSGWHRGYYGDHEGSCSMMSPGGMGGMMGPSQTPAPAPSTPHP